MIYMFIGIMTLAWFYVTAVDDGITGDDIIAMLPGQKKRAYLYNHPNAFKLLLGMTLILIVLLWPIVLWKLMGSMDDNNQRQ
jgi:hypothetical protein